MISSKDSHSKSKTNIELDKIDNSFSDRADIIKALIYFDLFNHPLTIQEIHRFSKTKLTIEKVEHIINSLLADKLIFQHKNWFSLNSNQSTFNNRKEANELAVKKMISAQKYSKLISKFPYVRAIFLSGSISKGVMQKDSDIDYFIITKTGRLWVCKLMLTLFKKIFLFNKHKNFCLNYFVSESALNIEEQNIFTATEIATLIPVVNYELYIEFMTHNDWIYKHLPNSQKNNTEFIIENNSKQKIERLLDSKVVDKLDQWFMNFTRKRYLKKHSHQLKKEEIEIAFKSTPHNSKVHPNHYQKHFLAKYAAQIKHFEEQHSLSLS